MAPLTLPQSHGMLQAKADSGVQRKVTASSESSGDANAELVALIPRIRPDLLLIKQVDQGGALNGRLPTAGGSPGPSPHYRHDGFGARADAGGPARGYGFDAGGVKH